jgi:hypothetical protein
MGMDTGAVSLARREYLPRVECKVKRSFASPSDRLQVPRRPTRRRTFRRRALEKNPEQVVVKNVSEDRNGDDIRDD